MATPVATAEDNHHALLIKGRYSHGSGWRQVQREPMLRRLRSLSGIGDEKLGMSTALRTHIRNLSLAEDGKTRRCLGIAFEKDCRSGANRYFSRSESYATRRHVVL
jgi:hypothetical protein